MDTRIILSIAGFDPSSGAGITADLKTIAAHGCYGVCCPTALTVQSTQGVRDVTPVSAAFVADTLACLADDFEFAAVKVGMLGSAAVTAAVAHFLQQLELPNIVVDPVLRSSSGAILLDDDGAKLLLEEILPLADALTPNVNEARTLAAFLDPMKAQLPGHDQQDLGNNYWEIAEQLRSAGARSVVITGGHRASPIDLLVTSAGRQEFAGDWIDSKSTHGTGCAFASSLACHLAIGLPIEEAVRKAKEYVTQALKNAHPLGKGTGPVNHFPKGWHQQ